ncbi:TPA: helix-turn-helix domain-containing protein [Staphylococcus aureus]
MDSKDYSNIKSKECVGKTIKQLRIANGLDQYNFAKRIKSTVSALSNWENGRNYPKDDYLYRISKAFNVSIEYIKYKEADNMNTVKKIKEVRTYIDGDLYYFRKTYLEDTISLRDLEELLYGETSLDQGYLQHLLENATANVTKAKENFSKEIDYHKKKIQMYEAKLSELNKISFIN